MNKKRRSNRPKYSLFVSLYASSFSFFFLMSFSIFPCINLLRFCLSFPLLYLQGSRKPRNAFLFPLILKRFFPQRKSGNKVQQNFAQKTLPRKDDLQINVSGKFKQLIFNYEIETKLF